jgi:hypothetical protein
MAQLRREDETYIHLGGVSCKEVFADFPFHELQFEKHCNLVAVGDDAEGFLDKFSGILVRWVGNDVALPMGIGDTEEVEHLVVCTIDDVGASHVITCILEYVGKMQLATSRLPYIGVELLYLKE